MLKIYVRYSDTLSNNEHGKCVIITCMLCQQISPKRRYGNVNLTSLCYVTNSVYLVAVNTIGPGPSTGFSSRGGQAPEGGAKNQKGCHIFKIQHWQYVATGGPNFKWGAPSSNGGGRAPLPPSLAMALHRPLLSIRICRGYTIEQSPRASPDLCTPLTPWHDRLNGQWTTSWSTFHYSTPHSQGAGETTLFCASRNENVRHRYGDG